MVYSITCSKTVLNWSNNWQEKWICSLYILIIIHILYKIYFFVANKKIVILHFISYLDFSLNVVVGAGTAGCVLANRLSEDPQSSILIVEAGNSADDDKLVQIPLAVMFANTSKYDWKFITVTQKNSFLGSRDKVWVLINIKISYIKMYQTR